MNRQTILMAGLLLALGLGAFQGNPHHESLDSTLWVQTSAEWEGLALQAFNAAELALDDLIEDGSAIAALEQSADADAQGKQPAIIVDVDETILDNSPYQARLLLDDQSYQEKTWDLWVEEAKARPVPGALSFLSKAAAKGVKIFYVTNRKAHLEEATRRNLLAFGFPFSTDMDVLLLRDEKENWKKDKGSRRSYVAKDYRVIMLFGDDLSDFISSARSDLTTRSAMVREFGSRFGRSWFLIPGPTYGSWHDALLGFASNLEPAAGIQLKLGQLDPRRK